MKVETGSIVNIRKSFFLAAALLTMTFGGVAQEKMSFHETDSLTFKAYLEHNWKEVIRLGKKAISDETDYYYLRIRIGIAQYSIGNYDQAIPSFKKALDFNQGDPVAEEYLYYAYLFSGQEAEASCLSAKVNEPLKDSLRIKQKQFKLYSELGLMTVPNADSLMAYNPGGGRVHNYQVSGYSFGALGISAKAGNCLTLTFGLQRLNFSIREQYQLPLLDPFTFDVSFAENSLYSGAQWYLKHGFTFLGGVRLLSGQYTWHDYQANPAGGTFPERSGRYRDLTLHAGLSKRLPFFNLGLSADVNRFKGNIYYQAGANLTVYPKGNLNLYLTGELSRTGIDSAWVSDGAYIWKTIMGFKIAPKIWLEAGFTSGYLQNWSENQAYIVYNNFDPILKRIGLNLISVDLFKNLDFSIRYNWTRRLASWEIIDDTGAAHIAGQLYPFHSLILGGTWRF